MYEMIHQMHLENCHNILINPAHDIYDDSLKLLGQILTQPVRNDSSLAMT